MRARRACQWTLLGLALALWCLVWGLASRPAAGQTTAPLEADAELARQQQIVERFLAVLERNPRRGTALDKIYGFHIENGTIEPFVKQLRERVAAKPEDGTGWMILGLVESQRGRDAVAVEALTKAKELRTTDALAAYNLGQSLVLVGQPEKAAIAFEEAIQRKPAPTDLLEIFQALGRVHQRAQRTEQALAVWSRLEQLFPGDPRVAEQIAVTLVEEGQNAEALPRYEALAKSTTDDYRRTVYSMEAAELKVKLKRASEGIADLEKLMARLNPESWLFREVRRKIEEVFLKTDDQDGLAKYYASWLEKNREDVEAMARLARVLARQARVPEAQEWLDKALKLAPSRKELRLAFIEQLVDDQRYAEAIQQYAALDKADPNNPDYLRDWGKLILRDTSRAKEERQTEAEKVWRRLLAARPTDPLVATQIADLCRHVGMQHQALELYQKAVELAPMQPQYREYLGEYYHILQRPEEAQATWRQIAEGPLRTAANLSRLAEVLAQFGYLKEALPEMAAACELDPKDYSLQLKAADLQIRGEQFEVALASLVRAEKLAQNDEEREAVLSQQLKTYTLQGKLADLAVQLDKETAGGSAGHEQWFLLARYREALHEYPEATKAINEALKLQPSSIPSLAAAARIAEQAGDLKISADLNRKLAVVDRRSRSEYLEHVAQLETQLGRTDEALAAGRDLIAAAPGNVETYQFFADLCFRLGRADDGIAALRRATRVNPNESNLHLALAAALAGQFRTDEAIELYWQAFEKGKTLDDKLSAIGKLTELYLQTNHFNQLLERLERGRREADQRREMTISLAQAYQSAGDYSMARQELERLLNENTRDTQLLAQLSKLAESESDLISAVKYQEQLSRLAPGDETEFRLATLLSRAGNNQEAAGILVRLAAKEENKEKLLRNIDSLLGSGQEDTALAILEPKLRENPGDWELLYRQGVALAKRNVPESSRYFQALLDLANSDDELSTPTKARQAAQQRMGGASAGTAISITSTGAVTTVSTGIPQRYGPFARTGYSYEVRAAVGLDPDRYSYTMATRMAIWTPPTFGQARMAALGWLYRFALDGGTSDDFVAERRQQSDKPQASPRELWDWIYLQTMRADSTDNLATATRLAERGDLAGQYQYLTQLVERNSAALRGPAASQQQDRTPPLEAAEMELALRSFKAVQQPLSDPRQTGSSTPAPYPVSYVQRVVMIELRRAGRKEDEERLYQEALAKTDTPTQIVEALQLTAQRNDFAAAVALFDRFAKKDLQANDTKSTVARSARASAGAVAGMLAGNSQATPAELLAIVDRYLDYHVAWTNQQRANPLNRPARSSQPQGNYIYIYSGGTQRRTNVTFPPPSAYYDSAAIALLRTAYEQFKQRDLVSDLAKHLDERATAAPAGDKIYAVLGLAYAQVWNDDQETAFKTLRAAAELVPQDVELRLDIARLYFQSNQLDEALALADAVTPLDQRVLQQREILALDLAVRLGDQERARQAAERLFGLRLDPETQVQLAGQMRRLGMAEEADAVIARAQRQAGNRLSALAALMSQYQSQGRMDVAVQVAHQILRRSRTQSVAQQVGRVYSPDTQYRTAALQSLSQAGKLKELIAGIESQLERSPQSSQLIETLAEYYQAAGDVQKMLDLQKKMVAMRPDEPELRYRYARELQQRGKFAEACDEYKLALKKQPRLMGNNYYYVVQAFQQARRELDLAKFLTEIDIRTVGQPYVAVNLIQTLMQNKEGRPAAIELLKKAWVAFPANRSELMHSFYDIEIWKTPDVFEFGRQAIIPTADGVRQNAWYGVGDVVSYGADGRAETTLSHLMDAGIKNGKLPAVREDVAKAVAEQPKWQAGPAILALIDLKLGKSIDGQASFGPLLTGAQDDYRLQNARWVIGQELASRQELQAIAIEMLKLAAVNNINVNWEFRYGPAQTLVRLYVAAGQREEAHRLLVEWTQSKQYDTVNDPAYSLYRRAEDLLAIGRVAQQLELPVDGLRAFREMLTNPAFNDPQLTNFSGRNPEWWKQQAQRGLDSITGKLADDPSGEVAQGLLKPLDPLPDGAAVLDLMLTAPTAGPSPATLESTLARLIKPKSLTKAAVQSLDLQLAALAQRHPRDMTVRIVRTLIALELGDAAADSAAVTELDTLVAAMPLEEIPAGQRANARQRAEAAQQIGLWLVAKQCLARPELRAAAERLAVRAVEAARRQVEPNFVAAIMYERGLLALDASDRAAAEREWNALIDLALVQPRVAKPKAATSLVSASAPATSAASPAQATAPPRAARPSGPIPATLSQFSLAAGLAQAAAEKNLREVSLRAVREALSGGLPVTDLSQAPLGGPAPRVIRSPTNPTGRTDLDSTVATEVATRMWQLSLTWRQSAFPPAEVCNLLEALVFPPSRPGDVLLYEQPVGNDWTSPRSVGRLLVEWSVRAGRAAPVRQQIAARRSTPNDILGGEVLEAQLCVALGERDEARKHLAAIGALLDSAKIAGLASAASHAAGFAFSDPQLAADAAPLLVKISQASTSGPIVNFSSTTDPLIKLLTRHFLKAGDLAAAKGHMERYLTSRQALYGRYGGDYGLYIQRQDLAWATTELARAGDLKTTLEMLGRFADAPKYRDADPPITLAIWHLARQARATPAAQRYAALRDWTLATKDRRSVRVVTAIDAGQTVPSIFLAPGDPPYEPAPKFGPISNLTLLIEAAAESGKLDELRQLVEPLAAEKIAAADSLTTLVLLAQKDAAALPRLSALTEATRERLAAKRPNPRGRNTDGEAPTPVEWSDYLVVHTALAEPEFADAAVKPAELLLDQARQTYQAELLPALTRDLAEHNLRSLTASERSLAVAPPLAHWFAGPASSTPGGGLAGWTAHDQHLVHVTGHGRNDLYFHQPLEGDFEFSFDARMGQFSQFALGFAGLDWSLAAQGQTGISTRNENVTRPALRMNTDGWNRITVRASAGSVRFYANGHLVFEDKESSRTSPWLHLQASAEQQPAMKNFRLAGKPVIPREIRLVEGERLEGWATWFDRLPPRLTAKEPAGSRGEYDDPFLYEAPQPNRQAPPVYDWTFSGGALRGRIDPAAAATAQSLLYYQRPLLAGDKIRYQFRYQPGLTHVHPVLGQIAFLLEPDGVRLHWVSPQGDAQPLEVDPANRVDDPSCRRGPANLTLKEDVWNDVELAVAGDVVTIRLNGQLICERPIESTSDRRFGLFRFKGQTAAEVKEIILIGDWPPSLTESDASDLLALKPLPASPAAVRARHALVGEQILSDDAYAVWQRAMSLLPAERYALLKSWVLPSPTHPTFRLQVDWTPTDPPPAYSSPHAPREESISRSEMTTMAHTGGELVSPALELVAVAKELGQLDALATAVRVAAKELPDQARPIAAIELLLAVARGDDATAGDRLKKSLDFVKQQPADTPLHMRHAEYVAAYAALARPALSGPALALAEQIVNDQKQPRTVSALWERRVRHLRARAQWAADRATVGRPFGAGPALTQWLPAERATARFRGEGFAPPAWRLAPGEATYLTGIGRDALYFAAPLAGDFELRCQRSTFGWREIRPLYACVALDFKSDGLAVDRQEIGRSETTTFPLKEKIKNWGPTVDYRLVVKDGTMTAYVNGQEVHSERLPTRFDPWLAIETHNAQHSGTVKNLQILGSPTIPREIVLSQGASLDGWMADYYGETDSGQNPIWSKKGDEITARKLPNCEGSFRESVLQYHRPLLEDGKIEYEFFYEPGKYDVHPALDRLALLLAPDGVKIHWLTDDQYDRTALAPNNAEPLAGSKPVPLKLGEWNKLKLTVKGDEIAVAVNGEEVASRKLEPTNRRILGLFRYADASAVRVKNVVHRGNWPTELPPVEQQELAQALRK